MFLASISTILGAILYLRFGYAVAHTGLAGTLLIIALAHLVTIPTALAVAEIATNRRVEGGGVYFIISRSFGTTIGGAIGIALFFSQAISVGFYMIAFAKAFDALGPIWTSTLGIPYFVQYISIPGTLILAALVLVRGARVGVGLLWGVAIIIGASLVLFWTGSSPVDQAPESIGLLERIPVRDPFMIVFATVFPAFTGMAAGVGLSGDLANPRRSIPLGVIAATIVGMLIYVGASVKLAASATPEALAGNEFIMADIASWGPIIPIGLACAALSSAIGSILVAPRTLQALGADGILPVDWINDTLARGRGDTNEPYNATLITAALALATVGLGNIDLVARIISMFFMATYGALCLISFLEHFAARPSYRPSFRSKWYISLVGFVMCVFLMFQMYPFYALLAISLMVGTYYWLRANRHADDLAAIFTGVLTQATRYSQIKLQTTHRKSESDEWRPSVIMVNSRTFTRTSPLQVLSWICHRYGVGTYLHFIPGQLSPETYTESRKYQKKLIELVQARRNTIYVDTIISPSMRSALAQALQLPGVSGVENNSILFEFSLHDDVKVLEEVLDGCGMAGAARINSFILRHGEHFFGSRTTIDVWLTWHDYHNANLMILIAYILLGTTDWEQAEIRIYAAFPKADVKNQRSRLTDMIKTGRLPISEKNLRIIPTTDQVDFEQLVANRSAGADLVIFGFTEERIAEKGVELFQRHQNLHDLLFVSAKQQIAIE